MQIVSTEYHTVCVKPFFNKYQHIPDINIGTVEMVYTHPSTGFIFEDNMINYLLTPNQMRSHGVIVSDAPKRFDCSSSHAIIATVGDSEYKVTLPLRLRGVISY